MSIERDLDVVIAAWLDAGPTDLPESNRRAISTAIRVISQRRRGSGLPWRDQGMPAFARYALAAAAVVAVAVGGIYLLSPSFLGPGGSGATPIPSPPASASPDVMAGRDPSLIVLTDAGCTWNAAGTTVRTTLIRMDLRNETPDFGNFQLYRLKDGHTWDEAVEWAAAAADALEAGTDLPPADFVIQSANLDVVAGERRLDANVSPGTYGVLCSTNEPPPGAVFSIHLVGPLTIE